MKILSLQKDKNIVAIGEIARFEQFLLLPQCFQKTSTAEASESVNMWERVKVNYDEKDNDEFLSRD